MTNYTHIAGKKVLLIEDDEFYINVVSQKLISAQCIFSFVTKGEDALPTMQKNIPDVVLLDMMLPGSMDGFALLEAIKKDDALKNVPIIILSNLSGPQDIERGMKLGAFRYLVKSSIIPNDILYYLESVFTSKIK
jgi:CheY-like chemotaxis protein